MSHTFGDKNYYELFNVAKDATKNEIRHAYAKLVRQYTNEHHPEEFMYIQEAYQVLSNPNKRREYDEALSGNVNQHQQQHHTQQNQNRYNTNQNQQQYNQHQHQQQYNQQQYNQQQYNQQQYNHNQNEYQYNNTNQQQYNQNQNTYYDDRYNRNQDYNTTQAAPSNYSLVANIIFSFILSIMFTPVVGIIAGIIIHFMKIPIGKVLGCVFWFIVALVILGWLFG